MTLMGGVMTPAVLRILGLPEPTERLPVSVLHHLAKTLGLKLTELVDILPVSVEALEGDVSEQPLSKELSDRIVALASVYARTLEVFEDRDKAQRWLAKPCRALGGKIPFSLLGTKPGVESVCDELSRIEYGVYS
jgi:putative toxin-antitoxin system antitoxin component (TIGR02293 family)